MHTMSCIRSMRRLLCVLLYLLYDLEGTPAYTVQLGPRMLAVRSVFWLPVASLDALSQGMLTLRAPPPKYWFGCSVCLVLIVVLSQDVPALQPWNPLYVLFTQVVVLSEKVRRCMLCRLGFRVR